jgi:AmiR/NasT family two-component response regulator
MSEAADHECDTDPTAALRAAEIEIDNLKLALMNSRRIGIAVGVLMVTRNVTEDLAFGLLSQFSQTTNRKLREIANAIVDGWSPR